MFLRPSLSLTGLPKREYGGSRSHVLDGDRGVSGNPPQEPKSARHEGPAAEGEVLYQEVPARARQPRRKGGTETGIANMYM